MALVSRRRLAQNIAARLRTGETRDEVIKQLAAYLIEHKQLPQLELYIADIEAELAHGGELVADVTTAKELDDVSRTRVKDYVQKTSKSSAVTLREHVDPEIVGGIIIRMPGFELDASVAGALRQLKVA